jgi:Trk K+ transport system NAD-binding subunit
VPIVGFLLLLLVGGLVYGEVYEALRGVTMPLFERPYVILQLMILEAPEEVPPELALVAFWYLVPLGSLILFGLGAADFLNLVFNRDDNRNPWAEALALTYQNHVIVLGAGHVGQRVIRDLVAMDLDVIAIDNSPSAMAKKRLGAMGVPIIRGDGRLPETLEKARLSNAMAFVACTGKDQANMESILKVRHSNPQVRIVSRMWDRQFADQLEKFLDVDSVLSSADLAAPAFAGAAIGVDITQTLEIDGVAYSTMRLTVGQGSFLAGNTVGDLQTEHEMDIVLVDAAGTAAVQPSRELEVQVGDSVVFFARHDRALEVLSLNMGKRSSATSRANAQKRSGADRRSGGERRSGAERRSSAHQRHGGTGTSEGEWTAPERRSGPGRRSRPERRSDTAGGSTAESTAKSRSGDERRPNDDTVS